ncbi:MAG TPA: hypothetical protein VK983_04520 [Candidatus Limnocylindrales bacterium]|nr:hypothetical protein [Candidatus Limnocylindrales bacterium]
MKQYLLVRVRLTTYFWIFFIFFLLLATVSPSFNFDRAALTLFSVNSFLYGFYIAPILAAQKARIEELHRIVRAEANALFSIMLKFKKLPPKLRTELQSMLSYYVKAKLRFKKATAGEQQYEDLIGYCLKYKGPHQEVIDKTPDALIANQQNRTNFAMQMNNRIYTNEWQVLFILFSITLGFILVINVSDTLILDMVRALLCTGLTMLIFILIKLSTLTHKKANEMWIPLQKLRDTHFYRID